jgi:hypothetical protein
MVVAFDTLPEYLTALQACGIEKEELDFVKSLILNTN